MTTAGSAASPKTSTIPSVGLLGAASGSGFPPPPLLLLLLGSLGGRESILLRRLGFQNSAQQREMSVMLGHVN
eukprot:CAMPEP_0194032302 /NCGR_PEP_ID=MMETSP0009_2-20130614/5278_1 /TAXON_ID=210454 /ORGANISM="Grammatophora oceanica, Strain CCMP 410" /LENGTH=72 /DNA_ID=CAMNT_0038672699 /DNA_START=266 /DNA_END=484 /DNA_ORIENTATION=-